MFRGFNQKLRFTPNGCGADLNESQCLRGFAQNPYAQLPFLGSVFDVRRSAFRSGVKRRPDERRSSLPALREPDHGLEGECPHEPPSSVRKDGFAGFSAEHREGQVSLARRRMRRPLER